MLEEEMEVIDEPIPKNLPNHFPKINTDLSIPICLCLLSQLSIENMLDPPFS